MREQLKKIIFLNILSMYLASFSVFANKKDLYQRGEYLMNGPVACGNCHVQRGEKGEPLLDKGLSGGMVFNEPVFKAIASNITPDNETGIGKWSDEQLGKAIREGIRPDGSVIGPPMPIEFYRKMSDEDLKAIIVYLRAQKPIKNAVAKSSYKIPLPPNYGPPITKVINTPSSKDIKAYGEYVVNISHCMDCHNPRNPQGQLVWSQLGAGGQIFNGPWGASVSRNLTPHPNGLKSWTDQQLATAIQQGVDRSGNHYKPPMAFAWYQNINTTDMNAIIHYLRNLKPLEGAK